MNIVPRNVKVVGSSVNECTWYHDMHTRIRRRDFFLHTCKKNDERKARERASVELAKIDEKSTRNTRLRSGNALSPMRDKNEGEDRGGKKHL